MNVLILGGGGREHALAWSLGKSPMLTQLHCAPGNAGIGKLATCVALDHTDHGRIASYCQDNAIGLVVVGPEAPLADGVVDAFGDEGLRIFGPSKAAAQLEKLDTLLTTLGGGPLGEDVVRLPQTPKAAGRPSPEQ